MNRSVAMIHTVASLVPTFNALAEEILPDVRVFHMADESLLTITRQEGYITAQTRRRLFLLAESARDAGVAAILVTCSSIGPAVEAARPFFDIALLRVDERMADEAIRLGIRIGVLATLESTLEPTRELIERRAAARQTGTIVMPFLCDGAFDAASCGDVQRHDALVRQGIAHLTSSADVIVLAQASMARAVSGDGTVGATPVLSSPRLAVEHLALTLAAAETTS